MARYRSEVHIPIKQDNLSFQDRQIQRWDDVESRMDQKRKEWESEFEKMRRDFFTLSPMENNTNATTKLDTLKPLYEVDKHGQEIFKIRFDVKEFRPEEVQVKVQNNKLLVNARHEEKTNRSTVSREYSRQVDIPSNVDQDRLQCVLSKDGVLSVEAPVLNRRLGQPATILPIRSGEMPQLESAMYIPSENAPVPRGDMTSSRTPIVTEPDGSRKLKLEVDVGEFRPEEVVVKTIDKKVVVTASHEETQGGRKMSKSFNKEYELPDSVDPMTVNAYMQENGRLVIEAPIKSVGKSAYSVSQTHDTKRVVVTRESTVTSTTNTSKPLFTISVHRRQ